MEITLLIFIVALGACVGSFLNVVIYRVPEGKSIVFPGSHCPSCGRAIKWYDNIPLVSWWVLRGKCRSCKVRISPRYLVIEAITALMVGGLFVWYYWLDLRADLAGVGDSWPVYVAHVALLCGLLVCSAVDIESWIVPLEVCWFVSGVGIAAATIFPSAYPDSLMPRVLPAQGAAAVAACVGLIVAIILQARGLIQPSFIDAEDSPPQTPDKKSGKKSPKSVAFTKDSGVNPRVEILREVLFLGPTIVLAFTAWALVTHVPTVREAWQQLHPMDCSCGTTVLQRHVVAFNSALMGYLVGGTLVWGIRILGTLGFGKEAMGLGDVHILAAVGAVCGWLVPSIAFFVAPFFGLLWAIYLLIQRRQRELPYGPWLAAATAVVLFFYDGIAQLLEPYAQAIRSLLSPAGG